MFVRTCAPWCAAVSLAASPAIEESARLHLEHIVTEGDPFELTASRPLDFGHWAGHKLEQMTGFDVAHGEAVAIGVALDSIYSALIDQLAWSDVDRILDKPLYQPFRQPAAAYETSTGRVRRRRMPPEHESGVGRLAYWWHP